MNSRIERAKDLAGKLEFAYREWSLNQAEQGNFNTAKKDFAKWIGIPNTTLSDAMKGVRLPGHETLDALANSLGPWVYDVAGVPVRLRDDKRLGFINKIWDHLTEEDRQELMEDAKRRSEREGDGSRSEKLELSFS